jgi:hypothetical protein
MSRQGVFFYGLDNDQPFRIRVLHLSHLLVMFLTLGSGRASEKDKSRSQSGERESELISLLGTVLRNHPTSDISYALASRRIRGRGHS